MSVDELSQLIGEHAALRRIATLVARGAPADELFAAATEEVGQVLGVDVAHLDRYGFDGSVTVVAAWSETGDHLPPVGSRWTIGGNNLSTRVVETCRPARIDSYADASGAPGIAAREAGHRSAVATPIVVDGRLWGAMSVVSLLEEPLADDTEARLAGFTDLLATAIANAASRSDLARLAEEQSALRRVATLVACGVPPQELFVAVTEEVGRLLRVDFAGMGRYEPDGTVTFVSSWSKEGAPGLPATSRWTLGGSNLSTLVAQTGRPVRLDGDMDKSGPIGSVVSELGVHSEVGTPIMVDGRMWGVIVAGSTVEQSLPQDVEVRLGSFTELVATAIANAESRAGVARLAEEQAALRRVATLVARGAPPRELFRAVTEEVGQLLAVDRASLSQYHSDGTMSVLSVWSPDGDFALAAGRRMLGGDNVPTLVSQTGRPALRDSFGRDSGPLGLAAGERGVRVQVGTPIVVEGHLWGIMSASSTVEQTLPPDTERRLASFTDLLATAIAKADSRAELTGLAEEHAALRRVATLVARGVSAAALFAAVAEEAGRLLGVELVALCRYEPDDTVVLVAGWSSVEIDLPALDSRWPLEGEDVPTLVARTGRPARLNGLVDASTPIGLAIRSAGLHSVVGTPIVVEGRLWGMIAAGSNSEEPLPPDTETRLGAFTDLLATAIANANSRAELAASRARIVAAADDARRRIERDLHDGAQQRLVALGLELRAAQATIPPGLDELNGEFERIARELARVQDGLREIARGIHPAILAHGGLGPVLKTVARRSPLPVEVDVRCLGRLPEQVEVAAYYVVSEALTNAAKHADASLVNIEVETVDDALRVRISDNGAGGADPSRGSGLVGLKDRVETLGGTIRLHSQLGAGTSIQVEIPISD